MTPTELLDILRTRLRQEAPDAPVGFGFDTTLTGSLGDEGRRVWVRPADGMQLLTPNEDPCAGGDFSARDVYEIACTATSKDALAAVEACIALHDAVVRAIVTPFEARVEHRGAAWRGEPRQGALVRELVLTIAVARVIPRHLQAPYPNPMPPFDTGAAVLDAVEPISFEVEK